MSSKEFLENIVREMVNNPDKVKIKETIDRMGVLLTIVPSEEDAGILVGRKGSTINALRTLVKVFGLKNKERVSVKLDIPEKK
jgi:predicted RNA-binding protein YlqC (UPF0109 family)